MAERIVQKRRSRRAVERVSGFLSDHYDPRTRVLRLSPEVFDGRSISSVGVAAHEAGHALQHARGYLPLQWRSAMVPITSIGSNLAWPLLMIGFILMTLAPALGLKWSWPGSLFFSAGRDLPARHAAGGVRRLAPRRGRPRAARDS